MNRGQIVAVALVFLALGWTLHSWVASFRTEVLAFRLAIAERDPDHDTCREVEAAMAAFIADQERRLDLAGVDPGEVVAEAERITEAGS